MKRDFTHGGVALTPEQGLDTVCRALEHLIGSAAPFGGLFPSVLDRHTARPLPTLPPAVPGQRDGDRSFPGANLMHDHATLKVCYGLATALKRPDFAAAADQYMERFATHCTDSATGLFPWGEHSFWNLIEDRPGNSYVFSRFASELTHDHLLQAPVWLWEKLWAANPRCVERFAAGLEGHWRTGEPAEYQRHASLRRPGRGEYRGPRSCDFPRHGGFYVLDWAFAHARAGRSDFAAQIGAMLDYWWERRDGDNLLPIESRSPETETSFYRVNTVGQTLSLAVSLLEGAELLGASSPDLAETMRTHAAAYLGGFLNAPHDLDAARFVLSTHRDTRAAVGLGTVWGSRYGSHPVSAYALLCLRAHALRPDARLLRWAEAVGRQCLTQPFPREVQAPAKDAGLALGLCAELFVVTGDPAWLEGGLRLAEAMTAIYLDAPLPRGAAGIDWYESQFLPGHLLNGVARLSLLARDGHPGPLTADFTAR